MADKKLHNPAHETRLHWQGCPCHSGDGSLIFRLTFRVTYPAGF
jgi:hypothetical protein